MYFNLNNAVEKKDLYKSNGEEEIQLTFNALIEKEELTAHVRLLNAGDNKGKESRFGGRDGSVFMVEIYLPQEIFKRYINLDVNTHDISLSVYYGDLLGDSQEIKEGLSPIKINDFYLSSSTRREIKS